MGKSKNPSRLAENEAVAIGRFLRTSPQKLNLVARQIRGKHVNEAYTLLKFSKKRIAQEVSKQLDSAVSNAVNNNILDADVLYVKSAYVGKSLRMKRFRARARGRAGRIIKQFSRLTIIVAERVLTSQETVSPEPSESGAS